MGRARDKRVYMRARDKRVYMRARDKQVEVVEACTQGMGKEENVAIFRRNIAYPRVYIS